MTMTLYSQDHVAIIEVETSLFASNCQDETRNFAFNDRARMFKQR